MKEIKILLVNPTRTGIDTHNTPPLHLMYLKKALKAIPDCVCEIMDVNYEISKRLKWNSNVPDSAIAKKKTQLENELIKKISEKDFDILGIGGIVPCYYFSEQLVYEISKTKPKAWIIIGGGLGMPLKKLWFDTGVNALVEGDGELIIIDIITSYPDREKLQKIPGVYCRNNNKWEGTSSKLPRDLDYIAYPDWEDIDYEYFITELKKWVMGTFPQDTHLRHDVKNARLVPVLMTRGCPYNCTFCFHFNRSYRKHSIEYIIDYLSHLKKRFGVNMVQTWDDLIITDRKWFLSLCEALKKKQLGIKIYMAGGKPSLIDIEMLRKMKEAGVVRMSYGVESGSPKMLKEMRKMVTVQENYNAVKWTVQEGIFTHLNLIVGMPGESKETLKETERFLLRLQKEIGIGSKSAAFHIASAFPGTELFDYAVNKGLVPDLRKYVIENKGAGGYSINFSGLGERTLEKFITTVHIEMDFNELRKNFGIRKAARLFFIRIPRVMLKFCLPGSAVSFLKKILSYTGLMRY